MPKVSVCIPTYNRAEFLNYSVSSVLKQTYSDYEIIICDDGSTDNTPELVHQWQDSRIRYIRHPQNIGRSRNMRSGFDAAQGDYFIKFDDDDALTPDFLEKTVAVLETHPQVDFVCTNHWVINRMGDRIEAATQANSAKWGKDKLQQGIIANLVTETFQYQSLQVGSTLFRRDCLIAVDYMRPEADGCEDFDLLVRLALAGKQGYFLPEFLMEYRFHNAQNSLSHAVHFLSAKLFCTDSYRFSEPALEQLRIQKVAELKNNLGLRLIEAGEICKGRQLLQESTRVLGQSNKTKVGFILCYLPGRLRKWVFQLFRAYRAKDYSEQVREAAT